MKTAILAFSLCTGVAYAGPSFDITVRLIEAPKTAHAPANIDKLNPGAHLHTAPKVTVKAGQPVSIPVTKELKIPGQEPGPASLDLEITVMEKKGRISFRAKYLLARPGGSTEGQGSGSREFSVLNIPFSGDVLDGVPYQFHIGSAESDPQRLLHITIARSNN